MNDKIKVKIFDFSQSDLKISWQAIVYNNANLFEHGKYYTNCKGCGLWKNNQQILGIFEFQLSTEKTENLRRIEQYYLEKWQYGLSKRLK